MSQSKRLRAVTGAYRATPIHNLEAEAGVPQLDIYLNERLVTFIRQLEATGKAELIRTSSAAVASWLRRRKHRPKQALTPHPEGIEKKIE